MFHFYSLVQRSFIQVSSITTSVNSPPSDSFEKNYWPNLFSLLSFATIRNTRFWHHRIATKGTKEANVTLFFFLRGELENGELAHNLTAVNRRFAYSVRGTKAATTSNQCKLHNIFIYDNFLRFVFYFVTWCVFSLHTSLSSLAFFFHLFPTILLHLFFVLEREHDFLWRWWWYVQRAGEHFLKFKNIEKNEHLPGQQHAWRFSHLKGHEVLWM